MSGMATAVIGSAVIGGYASSQASRRAADAQSDAADAGIAEQRRQYDAMQELLAPYVQAGNQALGGQQDILGLNGAEAQQTAISGLANSEQFNALVQQGENAMLQNASATGGLRGGNTQAALAQFRPQMLSALIDQQYQRLGGLTAMGQSSAAGVGNAGMQTGANIGNLLQQQGAAQAGNAMAQGQIISNLANTAGALGTSYALGGF